MDNLDRAPLDPAAAAILTEMKAANAPRLETMSPADARAALGLLRNAFWPSVAAVQISNVEPTDGAPVPLRLYRSQTLAEHVPAPGLIFFHGGGWTLGDLDGYDALCAEFAEQSGICVVSVDYRLAPEHRFPSAFEDAETATRWIIANCDKLGLRPDRLSVGGDSAGAALAASVALMLRGEEGHRLRAQLLLYPATDLGEERASYEEAGEDYILTAGAMRWFRGNYLGSEADAFDWRASPYRASDHENLPPTIIVTCGYDPLRDEGVAYGELLQQGGVSVIHHHAAEQMHGFMQWGGVLTASSPMIAQCARELAQLLD